MGLIDVASGNSVWRGLDYFKENKVLKHKKLNDVEYEGIVIGSNNKNYNVIMNIKHPRKSKCDCPHAKDRRIICKHIIALYFKTFPNEVNIFLKEVENAQKEYEEYEDEVYNKTIKYINSMTKAELVDTLVEIFDIAPGWVYDKFVRERVDY